MRRCFRPAVWCVTLATAGCLPDGRKEAATHLMERAGGIVGPVHEPVGKTFQAILRSLYRAPVRGGVAQARRAYAQMLAALTEARRETSKLKTDGVDGGREFLAAYDRHYQVEEDLFRNEVKEMIDSLDNLRISMVEREQNFWATLRRALEKEARSSRRLQLDRQEFALRNRAPLDRWIDPAEEKEKEKAAGY